MRFVKMHGIGNDYVYVNGFRETVKDPPAAARLLADRHFGIGGDGLILAIPADPPAPGQDSPPAHVRMRMFNADGSESEMCGNGIRCVCKLAHDHGITDANPMRIQTGRGILTLTYTLNAQGQVDQVTVDMGAPVLEPEQIPVALRGAGLTKVVDYPIRTRVKWPEALPAGWIRDVGLDLRMTCVSMGNPHLVLYCDHAAKVPLEAIGPLLETHKMFPRRINVHVVEVHSRGEVTMRTWERGSGITLACGTGASAVCVAGVLTNRTDRIILAHLPGGDLKLEWRESDGHLHMTGPATEVFAGEWPGQV